MKLSGGVVLLVIWVVSESIASRLCPENCRKNPDRPTCNTDTGVCSRGCVPGYHGDTCNRKCDVNCEGGTCQRRDGSCTCKLGYTFITGTCDHGKGVKCESNDKCLNNICLSAGRSDCLEGCKPGWFGEYCEERCSANCFCDKESDNCTSCIQGWYGNACKSLCSSGCDDKSCDMMSGNCNSCVPGWYGADCGSPCCAGCVDKNCERNGTCVDGCTTGSYGDQCHLKCSPHCESGCDQLTGDCVQCVAGWYGSTCESQCSGGCAGNRACDQKKGTCTIECQSGLYGSFCNLTCQNCNGGECDRNTGKCTDEKGEWSSVQSWIVGGVAVVVLIIIAVGFYMYMKRMHGVVNEAVRWRRTPSVLQDARPAPAPGHIQLEEEVSATLPSVCPIQPIRQTSYLIPRLSVTGQLQVQPHLQAAGVADQQEDVPQAAAAPPSHRLLHDLQRSSDEFDRPVSYTLPSYIEINEELMDHLPQPPQGAAAPAPVVNNSLFSVVADVHATSQVINIPLIAECFDPPEPGGSSSDWEPPSDAINYDHPFQEFMTQNDQDVSSSCTHVDDESKSIPSRECPLIIARPANYIVPQHSGFTVPTQQQMLSPRVSDQHIDVRVPTQQQMLSPRVSDQHIDVRVPTQQQMLSPRVSDQHIDVRVPTQQQMLSPRVSDQHSGFTVPTQQQMLSPRVSDQHSDDTVPTQQQMLSPRVSDQHIDVRVPTQQQMLSPRVSDQHSGFTVPTQQQMLSPRVSGQHSEVTVPTQQQMLSPRVSDQHSGFTVPTQQQTLYPRVSDQHSDDTVRTQQHMLSPRVSDQHSDDTVPTQQHMLSPRVSDQQQDEPEAAAALPSDRLLQDGLMATLPQPSQGAEASTPVVNNSSSLQ